MRERQMAIDPADQSSSYRPVSIQIFVQKQKVYCSHGTKLKATRYCSLTSPVYARASSEGCQSIENLAGEYVI